MAVGTARENMQVVTGNHIKLVMAGVEIGLAQNVSASTNFGRETVSGIGSVNPVEHPPTQAQYRISIGLLGLRKDKLGTHAGIARNGTDAMKGLVFDLEAYDKRDGVLLEKYIGCSFDSGETSINKHQVISRNCTLLALDREGDF